MQKLKIINQFSTHTSVQFYLFFLLCSRFYMVLDGTPWSSSPMWEMDAIKVDMRLRSLQSVFWSLLNLNIYSIHNIHVHYHVKKVFEEKTQWKYTWPLSNAYRQEQFEFLYLSAFLPKLFKFSKTQNLVDVAIKLVCVNYLLQFCLRIYIAWKGRLLPIKHIFSGRVSAKIIINRHVS